MNRMLRLLGQPFVAIRSRLKYQLLVSYMLIVILILAIVSIIFYDYFSARTVKENNISMEQLNKQIILNLDHAISALENTTFLMNYENDINELSQMGDKDPYSLSLQISTSEYKNIDNYFFNLIYSVREIYGVYIYSLNGNHIFSRNRRLNAHSGISVSQENWFQKAIERKGKKVLIGKHKNQFVSDGTDVISIARAIVNYKNDRLLGVIVVEQNISQIARIIDDIQIGEHGAVVILDDQNQLVYSNNDSIYQRLVANEQFIPIINENSVSSFSLDTGNDKLLVNQNSSEYIGWKVVTTRPYSEIVKEMVPFEKKLILLLVFCIAVAFVLSVLISNRMSKNLNQLKRFMEKVEGGNFDIRMTLKGKNEISKLSSGFNSMLSTIKHLIEVEYNEKLLRKETELSLLHAQINPHFLYNALGSIKSLAVDEGGYKTAQMIQHLVLLFRYNLGREGKVVSIKEEMEHIKNYLFLQQCRFEDKLDVQFHIENEALLETIPTFTLQPIIENAFVHGFGPKRGRYNLEIKCCYEGEFTKIFIKDNGVGISIEQQVAINKKLEERSNAFVYFGDSKIGIYNVNLRMVNNYGHKYGLILYQNVDEGVMVEVKLPRQEKIHHESGESYANRIAR